MTKKIKLKEPGPKTPIINLNQVKARNRFTFNFSFITSDKKYSLSGRSKTDAKVHKKLLEKIEALSKEDKAVIMGLTKEQGIEAIPVDEVKFRLNREFISSQRSKDGGDLYWVFRLNTLGRVIGKIYDNIFYVLAIDTTFDAYDHG
jgi:hypothetical protein